MSAAAATSCTRVNDRKRVAVERAKIARQNLQSCHLCAHHCGVDRLAGPSGRCHAGARARVFSAQVEVSDELELIPTFAIALSGCDLRCSFCITGKESWNATAGDELCLDDLSAAATEALSNRARSIMILGGEPTVHLPTALEIVSSLPDDVPLIWKTNAHGSSTARDLLDGIFDIWLADYKFGNDACAQTLAGVSNYTKVVHENLLWANDHSDLIVRHLLMPGHVECCWRPVAEWMAEHLPGTRINLRSGFWPAWQARRHPEFFRTTSAAETTRAYEISRHFNLRLIE